MRLFPLETDKTIINLALDLFAKELITPSKDSSNINLDEIISICSKITIKNEIITKLIGFISTEQFNEAFDFLIMEEDDKKDNFKKWPLFGLISFVYIRLGQFNRLLKLLR